MSTSGSRTAVVEQAGAKPQLASLVGAGIVVALLLFFNSLLADLPQSALAAVLIAAASSLLARGPGPVHRVRKSALVLSVVASLGVIVFGVLPGIVIAIVLAVLLFFRRSWQPHGAVLGEVENLKGWHDVERYPDAREQPGIVIYRWEAPLFSRIAQPSAPRSAKSSANATPCG